MNYSELWLNFFRLADDDERPWYPHWGLSARVKAFLYQHITYRIRVTFRDRDAFGDEGWRHYALDTVTVMTDWWTYMVHTQSRTCQITGDETRFRCDVTMLRLARLI